MDFEVSQAYFYALLMYSTTPPMSVLSAIYRAIYGPESDALLSETFDLPGDRSTTKGRSSGMAVKNLVACAECEELVLATELFRRKRRGKLITTGKCKDCSKHR